MGADQHVHRYFTYREHGSHLSFYRLIITICLFTELGRQFQCRLESQTDHMINVCRHWSCLRSRFILAGWEMGALGFLERHEEYGWVFFGALNRGISWREAGVISFLPISLAMQQSAPERLPLVEATLAIKFCALRLAGHDVHESRESPNQ